MSSPYFHVCRHNTGWVARIRNNGKNVIIGVYVSDVDAAKAAEEYITRNGFMGKLNSY